MGNAVNVRSGLVLAVGLDDLTVRFLQSAVEGTELSIASVREDAAVERATAESGAVIVLLEWTAGQEKRQARLCKALRKATRAGLCYIIALGGAADPALAGAMQWPANDVLSRPFGDEQLLLMRLRRVLGTVFMSRTALTPREALDEAVLGERSGEVVVRAGDVVGHIHMQAGYIVWADLSSMPATIDEILAHANLTLSPDIIAAARDESHRTRSHFMDVLVSWNMVEPPVAKEAFRSFIASRVERVMDLPEASALFLPSGRADKDRVRLSIDEIPSLQNQAIPEASAGFRLPFLSPPAPVDDISHIVDEVKAIEGAVSVAALDRRTGASLMLVGDEIDTTIAWSQLAALAALGPGAEDVLGSVGGQCFVTRPLAIAPDFVLFVVLSRSIVTIGMARSLVGQIASNPTPREREVAS